MSDTTDRLHRRVRDVLEQTLGRAGADLHDATEEATRQLVGALQDEIQEKIQHEIQQAVGDERRRAVDLCRQRAELWHKTPLAKRPSEAARIETRSRGNEARYLADLIAETAGPTTDGDEGESTGYSVH